MRPKIRPPSPQQPQVVEAIPDSELLKSWSLHNASDFLLRQDDADVLCRNSFIALTDKSPSRGGI